MTEQTTGGPHLPQTDDQAVQGEAKGGTQKRPQAYSANSGMMGYRLAKDIIRDPRLQKLSARSLGAYLLIKAFDECRQPVSARSKIGSLVVRLTVPAFLQVRAELENATDPEQPPLVVEIDGMLRAGPVGEPMDATTQKARIRAAERRWEEARQPEKKEKPVKAAKRVKKQPPVLSPAEALKNERLEAVSAAALVRTPPVLPLPPQASLFDGMDGLDSAAEKKIPPVPWAWMREAFNRLCPTLPKAKPPAEWNEARRRQVAKHWNLMPVEAQWEAFFTRVEESNFLCGRVNSFKASIDWVINDGHFLKINEGNYDNRGTPARRGLFSPTTDQFRVGTYGEHNIDDADAPWATPATQVAAPRGSVNGSDA